MLFSDSILSRTYGNKIVTVTPRDMNIPSIIEFFYMVILPPSLSINFLDMSSPKPIPF